MLDPVLMIEFMRLSADSALKLLDPVDPVLMIEFVRLSALKLLDPVDPVLMIECGAISEIPPVLVTRPVHRRRNSLSFFTEGLFL